MGMTNRVIPAQGEERGASYSLIRLDGDAIGKFQSTPQHFLLFAHGAVECAKPLNIMRFCAQLPPPHKFLKRSSAPGTGGLRECRIECQPLSDAIQRRRLTRELVSLVPIAPHAHIDLEGHR